MLEAEKSQQAADSERGQTWSWAQYEDVRPVAKCEGAGIYSVEGLQAYARFQMLARTLPAR